MNIRDEFLQAKEDFLGIYDQSIQNWIAKHRQWGEIIKNSIVSPDYVRARMDFRWQMLKVAPLMEHEDQNAVLQAGLAEEVTGLGRTLFNEIAKTADDIWHRVYEGVTSVTHKALSPLRTLHQKLVGLSFVEPHVAPVADIVDTVLKRMPPKGNIIGADLLLLQGLVCLLRDSDALLIQAQSLIDGYEASTVLDSLLSPSQDHCPNPKPESTDLDGCADRPMSKGKAGTQSPKEQSGDKEDGTNQDRWLIGDAKQAPMPTPQRKAPEITSLGLW